MLGVWEYSWGTRKQVLVSASLTASAVIEGGKMYIDSIIAAATPDAITDAVKQLPEIITNLYITNTRNLVGRITRRR